MRVATAVGCPTCGKESGVSMPGSVLQPLLDELGYQNPRTLTQALRPGETVLVLCRASVGGLAATDQRVLLVKNGQAHEYGYTDIQDIHVEKVGWFLSAIFELVTNRTGRRQLKKSKEADQADYALSYIRPFLPLYQAAKRRVLEIRDARRCRSCGAFVAITPEEWSYVGRPEIVEPIPAGGANVLATRLEPDERISAQTHAAGYYKSIIVTDRRVMFALGRDEKQFHTHELAAVEGAEADANGLYVWLKGKPRHKAGRPQIVASDHAIPANESDLPKLQKVVAVIEGLIGH
jgi:hypothetical protein